MRRDQDSLSVPEVPEDPIDAEVRAIWMVGFEPETERLRAGLKARLGMSPLPLQPASEAAAAQRQSNQSVASSPRFPIRYTIGGVLLGAVLLVTTWRTSAHHVAANMASHSSVYATASGERATVTLPDGSTVALNVASRLEVPSNYAAGNRALRLSGEAMFTVRPAPGAPFTVEAGSTTTRVLGTRFVIRHYPTDTVTNLAVQDGKVSIQSTVITASQQVVVHPYGSPVVSVVSPDRFAFESGVLALDGQRLMDAIPELNRWYNADIRLGNVELQAARIGGEFAAGSLNDLTRILVLTFGIRVERSGRILTLYSR